MDPVWQVVIWSVIPFALLLLACAAGVYGVKHRQPHRQEDPVERAYLAAKARAPRGAPEPEHDVTRQLSASSR